MSLQAFESRSVRVPVPSAGTEGVALDDWPPGPERSVAFGVVLAAAATVAVVVLVDVAVVLLAWAPAV